MDLKKSTESVKDTNTLGKSNKPLMECIRKFPLIQQFPSTIKEFNTAPWSKMTIRFPIPSIQDIKNIPNLNTSSIPCKKLRIVSPNGRDLGEFNLEIRNKNASTGQIYTITKSNIFKPVSKSPVVFTLNPLAKKTLPRILRQTSANIKNKVVRIMPKGNNVIKNDKSNISAMHHMISNKNHNIINTSEETQPFNDEMDKMKIENGCNKMLIPGNEINQKLVSDCTAGDNSQKHPEMKNELTTSTKNMEHTTKVKNIISVVDQQWFDTSFFLENNRIPLTKNDTIYKEIAESPFPKVSCKRLKISNNNTPVYNEIHKEKGTSPTKTARNKKASKSSNKVLNYVRRHKEKGICSNKKSNTKTNNRNNIKSHSKQVGSSRRKNNLFKVNSKVKQRPKVRETRAQKNIMTIVPKHNNLSFCKNTVSTLEYNKFDMILRKERSNKDPLLGNDIQFVTESKDITDMVNTYIQSNEQSKDFPKKSSSQGSIPEQWDVIKKAVNSVKDDSLRAQALKALADCCIGVEKFVPKHPPEELKSVHDTQVQTTVFGLLDPTFFVLINKDKEDIQRIQQVTLNDTHRIQDLSLQNNLDCNIQQPTVSKNFNMNEEESDFDIDSFMNEICEEHLGALQVKETLSTTNIRYQKIIDQLQKDFELAKKYDENGMLSIHNAVLKNNIFDVQRYLMVLKQCKENIDIMTMDGVVSSITFSYLISSLILFDFTQEILYEIVLLILQTSLELAIKYDICSDIVKFLLQSGAQPVKMQPLHESALIIAAKQSSRLLPELVNYISNPKLLDLVDSEGKIVSTHQERLLHL